ncbi:hypothetical protein [Methanolobus sp. WCC4]|uniref:hypothetical protein n=1 Tax=Methanolobus sp. WCC4 TaxID=3125784 RepID=UPI0030F73AF1
MRWIPIFMLVFILFLPTPVIADDITITYDQVLIGDNHIFWYGQGELISEAGNDFFFDYGESEILTTSSSAKAVGLDDSKIHFSSSNDVFEANFLSSMPETFGTGIFKVYTIKVELPEVNEEKKVQIKIEDAGKIIVSNVDIISSKTDGQYLILNFETKNRDMEITYITKPTFKLFSILLATALFSLLFLILILIRRIDILEGIKMNVNDFKKAAIFESRMNKDNYELSLDLFKLKLYNLLEISGNRFYLRIPFWLFYCFIFIVLLCSFFRSMTYPVEDIWNMLNRGRIVIFFFVSVLALLSLILIASIRTDRDASIVFGLIGGCLVGIILSHFGSIAVILSLTTALLIYFLSMAALNKNLAEV